MSRETAVARLKAAGVEPGEIIDAGKHVPGLRICSFKDPAGNIVELMHGWLDEDPAE